MDRITASLLSAFRKAESLEAYDETEAFERFANYAVINREYGESFNVEDVSTGEESDTGIDGVAIIVNGALVTDENDVDSLIESNGFLDVTIVLVQAKTSASFNSADIGTFCFGVKDFFADIPKLPRSQMIKDRAKLTDHIYGRSDKMTRRKPNLHLYYVTTGRWTGEAAPQGRIDSEVQDLKDTDLFEDVCLTPVDANLLQTYYRQSRTQVSAKFKFEKKVVLPDMDGVAEAHVGILPVHEYLGIIEDPSGNIRQSIFYDNVRDFQEYNEVNRGIRETIESSDQQERFVLLNNGITLIAKSIHAVGNTFHIDDFQIVNGCQTSHVLYDNKASIGQNVYITLKVIATDDDSITNAVIKGTNRQTVVKPEQLYGLSEFQKHLESFYSTFDGHRRLYYERRSKQYARSTDADVEKVRIVTIQQQMRVFASMFLDEPHRGHYPRSLHTYVGTKIFGENHQLEPYYVSAYAHYRLEFFFRNRSIDARWKPGRYHILMVSRHLASDDPRPALEANQMRRYSDNLMKVLWNEQEILNVFRKACEFIDRIVGSRTLDRNLAKTQPFTEEVVRALQAR